MDRNTINNACLRPFDTLIFAHLTMSLKRARIGHTINAQFCLSAQIGGLIYYHFGSHGTSVRVDRISLVARSGLENIRKDSLAIRATREGLFERRHQVVIGRGG
jgi:hypothetical protein